MIALPQTSQPATEQVISQALESCGLQKTGFKVSFKDELQSVLIEISATAGASAANLDCIGRAAGLEIVLFADRDLQQAYQARQLEAARPAMLADARAELKKYGVSDNIPDRSTFKSDKAFTEALERHCGLAPGSVFKQGTAGVIAQPRLEYRNKAEENRVSCVIAALIYVTARGDDVKLGFIGNEALAEDR